MRKHRLEKLSGHGPKQLADLIFEQKATKETKSHWIDPFVPFVPFCSNSSVQIEKLFRTLSDPPYRPPSRSRGSVASCSASPITLYASTVRNTAKPGYTVSHHNL